MAHLTEMSAHPCAHAAAGDPGTPRLPASQRGAAIVTAMLVVALAAVIVSGLFARESLAVRSVENRASLAQTRWVERAVIDWAQVILRVDDSTYDHATDVWATPVMQTELDETVAGGARFGDRGQAFLTGAMIDAQSRFNINSLVTVAGLPSQPHLQALRKLFGLLGVSPELAASAQMRVMQAQTRSPDGRQIPAQAPPVLRMWDLRDVPGFDEAVVISLLPYVTVLPRPTRINLNTAPAEVIASMAQSITLEAAKQLVVQRQTVPLRNLATALRQLGVTQSAAAGTVAQGATTTAATAANANPNSIDPNMASINTNYFMVSGTIKYDRVESQTETLLRRDGNRPNALVQVVWQQRN